VYLRALADTDADGKMNIIEFSIACKLISLKLRNVEVPKQLPPMLISSLKHVGTPIRTPTGTMSPVEGYKQFIPPAVVQAAPIVSVQPQQQFPQQPVMPNAMVNQGMVTQASILQQQQQQLILQQQQQQHQQQQVPMNIIPQQTMPAQMIPQQVVMSQIPQQMIVQPQQILAQQQQQPIVQQQQVMPLVSMPQPGSILPPSQPPIMTSNIPPVAQQPVAATKPTLLEQLSSGSLLESLAQTQPVVPPSGNIPAAPTPTPPQSGHASRSTSFSEKPPSIPESP
jgi:hypothetical protein